jgi:hypothetical protein
MHRLITLACAVTAATLLVVGCGSSDDSGSSSNGGSTTGGSTTGGSATGGSGGGSSAAKCADPAYADVTASDFPSQTVGGLACANASDAAGVCDNDLAAIGAGCGKTCLTQVGMADATQAACVGTCINQMLLASSAPLADACLTCYTSDVACARKMCFAQCAFAPTSDACAQCRIDMGCTPTFYSCSGLPIPTGLDLGTGMGAGGSAGSGS